MPKGLLVLRWNERSGVEVWAEYPKNFKSHVNKRTLLEVYNLHQFSKEPGIASLTVGDVNFISYYPGPPSDFYILLMLNLLENPEDFEDLIKDLANKVDLTKIDKQKNQYLGKIYKSFFKKR